MDRDDREKRRQERVRIPYILKYRSLAPGAPANWDAVTPINMSEAGVCFLTMEQFLPGTEMFLLVTNPMLAEERVYDCKVLRSGQAKGRSRFYETVVTIENMDEETKEAYLKVLEDFRHHEKK